MTPGTHTPKLPDIDAIHGYLNQYYFNKFQGKISTMDYLTRKSNFDAYHNLKAGQVQDL